MQSCEAMPDRFSESRDVVAVHPGSSDRQSGWCTTEQRLAWLSPRDPLDCLAASRVSSLNEWPVQGSSNLTELANVITTPQPHRTRKG